MLTILHVSSFQHTGTYTSKTGNGQSQVNNCGSIMNNATLAYKASSATDGSTTSPSQDKPIAETADVTNRKTSINKNEAYCIQSIREALRLRQIPGNIAEVLLSLWRGSTQQQYWTYFQKMVAVL